MLQLEEFILQQLLVEFWVMIQKILSFGKKWRFLFQLALFQ